MKAERLIYIVILFATFLWCLLIVLPPILSHWGGADCFYSAFIYLGFSRICHQIDARSFHLFGEKFAVCSRCTGIYFGFLLGLLILPFLRKVDDMNLPPRGILLIALVPMFLDFGCDALSIYQNTLISRSITGLLLGIVLVFFITPSAISAVRELLSKSSKSYKPLNNGGLNNADSTSRYAAAK